MSDIVSPLLQWLNANPEWAGFVTFLISAAESVAIIGTIVPGSVTMTAIGTLAGAGVIPLWATILWAILGAIVGDGISYWLGYYFKGGLRRMWPFRSNPGVLEKGERFVNKYGVMSVFIGRFVGPVRALVPLVAGMLGMRPLLFTVANIASAIGWAPAYMLPGILLGAASLELPPDIAIHVILVLLLIFLFVVLCVWVTFKLLQLISKQTENLLIVLWNRMQRSRYFHGATVLLQHRNPNELHGQLILAFYLLVTLFLCICLCVYVKAVGANHIFVNDAMYHFFRGIRNPTADTIMLGITLLGQKEIILPATFLFAIWLFIQRSVRTSLHLLLLIVLTASSIFIFKNALHSLRPWGIFASPETYSMPSGHTTLATAIYVGIAFLLTSTLSANRRKYYYFPAMLIALMVGISRMYLGAHWFTDILAAWLLGAAISMFVVLSFNRNIEKNIPKKRVFFVGILILACIYSYYFYSHITLLKKNYAQIDVPLQSMNVNTWWHKENKQNNLRVSLFGFPSQKINIEWQGNLEEIKNTLFASGWEIPPARDWISTLHRITDVQSNEYLPMVSPQFLDKKPALILAKRINGGKKLLVLRLWSSNLVIKETQEPLWVGTVGLVPRSYSWLFRKHHDLSLKSETILSNTAKNKWQWKLISPEQNSTVLQQSILLIKANH